MGDNLWLFGMSLNILGSVMVNFGTNLMKSAHNLVQTSHVKQPLPDTDPAVVDENNKSSLRIWRIGMGVFVAGSFINFSSFAFAAQSLLAALGTVQFVSNVVFAKCVLKEQLTMRIFIATGIIIFGLVTAIRFSNHASEQYTTKDLIALYDRGYLIFLLVVFISLISLHCVYLKYTAAEEKGIRLPGSELVRPGTYALVSATVGTQSVLQSKCIAELVKASIKGQNQFGEWFLYFILFTFIAGLSFWLHRMNAALKKFDGMIIIPLLQVFWTTSAILQGGVYFKEFEKFSPLQTVGFCMGVCIVFIGVFLLTPHRRKEHEPCMEQALIREDGTPSQYENEMDGSTRSNRSNGPDGLRDKSDPRQKHTHFSNCGLSVIDDSERGSVSMERLLSLTYMPVVLNDASVAFYMDRAFITSGKISFGPPSTPTTLPPSMSKSTGSGSVDLEPEGTSLASGSSLGNSRGPLLGKAASAGVGIIAKGLGTVGTKDVELSGLSDSRGSTLAESEVSSSTSSAPGSSSVATVVSSAKNPLHKSAGGAAGSSAPTTFASKLNLTVASVIK